MNQQLVHLIIVLIIVGGSVVRLVVTKLQEEAAKRRAQQAAERRRLEALRTGRDPEGERSAPPLASATVPPASQDLQDLARRRAAQLAELRRLQQSRAKRPAQAPPRDVIARIPGSAGPTVPGTRASRSPAPPPAAPRAQPRPRPAPKPAKGPQPQAPAPSPAAPRRVAALADPAPLEQARPLPEAQRETVQRLPMLRGTTVRDWRRAVVMSEALSTPLALRSPESGPLARRF